MKASLYDNVWEWFLFGYYDTEKLVLDFYLCNIYHYIKHGGNWKAHYFALQVTIQDDRKIQFIKITLKEEYRG